MNIVLLGLGGGLGAYAAYQLFVSGTSDLLGLKTLRHGTGPCNYVSIQLNGALPDKGGKASGETTLMGYTTKHTEKKFFVWNDDYHKAGSVDHDCHVVVWLLNCRPAHPLVKRLGAKYYCIQGGVAACSFKDLPAPLRIALQVLGGIAGFFTPTLDFHITPEKFNKKFQVDENMVPVAHHTAKPLKSLKYIGLPGVLYQGLNKEVFTRICQDPARFVKGVTKVLLLTALVLSILSVISTYAPVPELINVYSLISEALASPSLLTPLATASSIALPCFSLLMS